MTGSTLKIEPTESHEMAACPCCGLRSRTVWGLVYADGIPRAAYYVHWAIDRIHDRGAYIDLIIGDWGDTPLPQQRSAVALEYRLLDTGPAMRVIDATGRIESELVTRALKREEVIGTELADEVFAIADACLDSDGRLAELLEFRPFRFH